MRRQVPKSWPLIVYPASPARKVLAEYVFLIGRLSAFRLALNETLNQNKRL
jgi:hypothetical protein